MLLRRLTAAAIKQTDFKSVCRSMQGHADKKPSRKGYAHAKINAYKIQENGMLYFDGSHVCLYAARMHGCA